MLNFDENQPRTTVANLGGVPVNFDITAIFVPMFFASSLMSTSMTSSLVYGLPVFLTAVIGIFGSIFLHELGHMLAARRYGVPVSEIVIGGFFGYARMTRKAPSRGAAAVILFAGPLANLLIFLWCWVILGLPEIYAWGYLGGPTTAVTSVYELPWLAGAVRQIATINLWMFVFNLLPAFPLDGGRIYRLLISRVAPMRQTIQFIAICGMILGSLVAFRSGLTNIIGLLIGLQIAIMNLAIFKEPVRGEMD